MAPLIVPSILRCTATGRTLDDRWACVSDLYVVANAEIPGSTPDRASQIRQATDRLWDGWYEIFRVLSNTCYLDQIAYVDLDLEDGQTGTVTGTTSHPGPLQGQGQGDASPSNIAALARKVEAKARRGVRSGRMFIPGIRESMTTGNQMEDAAASSLQDRLDEFLASVNNNGDGSAAASSELRTVHVPATGAPFSSSVTELQLQPRVTHQDRRLNRY